jgi:formate hydrogenlyase subunit 3/multisubunit Na+/H+ antiporter MnhD subunit
MAGAIFILIGIPPILEKIPPNPWYGFRVAKTFSDERIWYAANRVMGYDMLIAGLVIAAGAIITTKRMRGNPRRANRICFLIFLVSLMAALAHGFWALNRM